MREVELVEDGINWTAGRKLRIRDYAADICLLADDLQNMTRMTEAVVCKALKLD